MIKFRIASVSRRLLIVQLVVLVDFITDKLGDEFVHMVMTGEREESVFSVKPRAGELAVLVDLARGEYTEQTDHLLQAFQEYIRIKGTNSTQNKAAVVKSCRS